MSDSKLEETGKDAEGHGNSRPVKCKYFNIGTWNVRSMNGKENELI